MTYEPVDIDLTTESDPTAWQFLQALKDTTAAVEAVAYNMRIVTHLLANSDHRHLAEYAADMSAAIDRLGPADAAMRQRATEVAGSWGAGDGASLSAIVSAAPPPLAGPLGEALGALQSVTRELQEDGAVASEVLEAATQIVSRRCRELEHATADPTYRPPVDLR